MTRDALNPETATEAETYRTLQAVFRDVFDDEGLRIDPDTTARDIPDWDSQANITLVVATEQRFGIRFRTAEIERLRDVRAFVGLIRLKQAEARP